MQLVVARHVALDLSAFDVMTLAQVRGAVKYSFAWAVWAIGFQLSACASHGGERSRGYLAWAIRGVARGVMLWVVKINGKPANIGIWVKWVIRASATSAALHSYTTVILI